MSVSISSGVLDLFSSKFGLDGLGMPGEKVMIRVVVASHDGFMKMTLFGNYIIGGRHAQIASREIEKMGATVDVVSASRYGLRDFVEDVNKGLEELHSESFRLVWQDGKAFLNSNEKLVAVTFQEIYPTAGRACGVFECRGKYVKVILGQDVELFDLQRRKLAGVRLTTDKLILERAFQHLEGKHRAAARERRFPQRSTLGMKATGASPLQRVARS